MPKAGLALQGAPEGDTAERCASVQRTETTESFVRVLGPALAQKKARSRSRIGTEKSPSKSARAFGAEGGTCKERSDGIANAERGRLDIICQGA